MIPVWLLRLLPYGVAVLLAVGALLWARQTGVAYERAKVEIAALQADKAAQAALLERWQAAAKETADQLASERADAAAREADLADRIATLKTDRDIQDAAASGLEQDLAALAKDKDQANALIAKLRTAIGTGRHATAADVEFDRRMLSGARTK